MSDQNEFHQGPQREAIPRMLIFIATIVALAIGILLWFALGN